MPTMRRRSVTGSLDYLMRVVAGAAGGRRLLSPATDATRPTTDRMREAIFNSLSSMCALDEATVLDLFAGTGACGIEALSRGAAAATFVENHRKAIEVVRRNLSDLDLANLATVVSGDALAFISRPHQFDVAIVDPPYRFDKWPEVLESLNADIVVCESERGIAPGSRFEVLRERTHGATHVTFLKRMESE